MRRFLTPPILLAALSGVLLGTSYIPFPPWAVFFCYVPLWFVWLHARSWKQVLLTGWVAQFVGTLIGFNWVAYTVHEFGHMPWPVAILTLIGFAAIANLHIPLAGLAWRLYASRLRLSRIAAVLALPVVMSIAERVSPMIFDWHFGYTWLWAGYPAFQLADVIGFLGLSTIGNVFNGFLLLTLLQWREGRRWWPWAAAVPAIFVALNLAGYLYAPQPRTDAVLRFLVVQANIGNQEKLAAEEGAGFRDTVVGRFEALTARGLTENAEVDFVVWPETAFPEILEDPLMRAGYGARLRDIVEGFGTRLITGGYSVDRQVNKVTNSFLVLGDTGEWLVPPYHKTVLLAFGEYLPGGDLFPGLYDALPQVGNFGRGPGPTVLNAGGARLGAQICYEGLFDWFTRRLANDGAQVIVNLTNDSWYGAWQQPYQHLYMTLARAVEVRRPLVRSTNTGISAAILASGEVLETSPTYEDWYGVYEIPYATDPTATPFMSWGYWLIPALLALAILVLPRTSRHRAAASARNPVSVG